MSTQPKKVAPVDPATTSFDLQAAGGRLSIAGPALAVIALVALVGIIWLSSKLVDLNERVILQPGTQIVRPLERATTELEPVPARGGRPATP
jgi:hypothetical protein